MSTVRLEAVRSDAVEIPLQPASQDIWDKKYRLKSKLGDPIDRTIDDSFKRVAPSAIRWTTSSARSTRPG